MPGPSIGYHWMVMKVWSGIEYLECAYGMRYYIIDHVNGHISAIHDDIIELTEFLSIQLRRVGNEGRLLNRPQ